MLNINTEFNSGIYFVRLEGSFNKLNYNIYIILLNIIKGRIFYGRKH